MPKIVVDVPEGYEDIGELLKDYVKEITAATPDTRGGRAVDFAKFERAAEQSAAKLERETLRRLLQSLDIDAERVWIGGKEHARVGRYKATYSTQAGPVEVERSIYRDAGERNGKTVDPVSLRAGTLEGGWLPSAARAMAHLMQQGTSREAEATALQLGRLPYSRSSFERVGQAVGGLFEARRLDVEEALAEGETLASEVRAVSASLDRVAVPMEESRKRPRGRPRKGAPARPVARVFRMAYCATVTGATVRARHCAPCATDGCRKGARTNSARAWRRCGRAAAKETRAARGAAHRRRAGAGVSAREAPQ